MVRRRPNDRSILSPNIATEARIQDSAPQLFATISQAFGGAPIPPSWTGFLAEHRTLTSRSRPLPFEPDVARAMARRFISTPEIQQAVLIQIDAILDDDALRLATVIAWHFLFTAPDAESDPRRDLIAPTVAVVPKARLFYVPLFLARIPSLLSAHADLGVPAADTEELLSDIERWIGDYRSRHGVIGFDKPRWLYHHFRSQLFQFGRLQFEPCEFAWPFRVIKRAVDTEYLVLVEAGREFRADGQFSDADLGSHFPPRIADARVAGAPVAGTGAAGTTSLALTRDRIIGHRVDDRGRILPEATTVVRREWNEVVGPGLPVVAVHIPASGPLDPDAVSESFERAMDFFSRYEPDTAPRAFTCESWLMDRQIDRYLGPESNIVAFQRRFLPLPLPAATDDQHFERVFGEAPAAIDDAPQENRLQRALVSHIRSGLAWRVAGGLVPLPASRRAGRPVNRPV